jgi:hypothetical protein
MMKKNKKQIIFALILVLCLFVLLYLFVLIKNNGDKDTSDWISTSYKESSDITIKNILPISDQLGKTIDGKGTEKGIQGYVEFTVTNNLNKKVYYDIFLKKNNREKEIKSNYIKLYLTDDADKPLVGVRNGVIPVFSDLKLSKNNPNLYFLASKMLDKGETSKLKLRAWLSDSYSVTNDSREFAFTIIVKAK